MIFATCNEACRFGWIRFVPCKAEDTEFRTEAIRSLNDIFLNASEVTVISNDLLLLEYRHEMEIWVALRTSVWMRRWWTFQEGTFAVNRLSVRFKNELIKFEDNIKFWLLRLVAYSPNLMVVFKMTSIFQDPSFHNRRANKHIHWDNTKGSNGEPPNGNSALTKRYFCHKSPS
jgi:hypothetical protein